MRKAAPRIVRARMAPAAMRKTDSRNAYFGCHTDITIPYDELGEIVAVTAEGEETAVIQDGRFVLEGCEILNEPFENNEKKSYK